MRGGPGRLLGLELPRLAGGATPPRLPAPRWFEHYALGLRHRRGQLHLLPLARTAAVARWVEQTPPGFLFAIKASRYLTQVKRLADKGRGVERLYEPLQPLVDAGRLGPVLWQLPPNFKRDDELRGEVKPIQSAAALGAQVLFERGPVDALDLLEGAIAGSSTSSAYFNNDW
ncbi:MAG: DUF72 domain-containing protein [Solirubrobacteraceae bacterium]